MCKKILLSFLTLTITTALYADYVTDSLRHDIEEAREARDVEAETLARERLTVTFYNQLEYDSLLALLPECMSFYEKYQDWEHYYYMWRMKVSAFLYSNRNNTALREARQMYADAHQRKNDYGIAMASHVMGLAYSNIHYYEEAQKAIERGLKIMTSKGEYFMQVSFYGDYSEVLSARKQWRQLLTATEGWHQALIGWGKGRGMSVESVDSTVFATYCFVAQAKAYRGLGNYDAAERLLHQATRNAKLYGEDSDDGYWHHVAGEWAEYYSERADYVKALRYNDEMIYWARQRDVESEIIGAEQQRAVILMGLGRYHEASELWQHIHETSQELNLKDAKNQLTEMNALFQLDEMTLEQQKTRSRYTIIIFSLIVVALIAVVLVVVIAARRLASKNRQLAVALQRAQESDEMKSAFIRHVSHEIRTPLNIINGFTQVVNTSDYEVSAEERTEMIRQITDNTRQVTQIVNELLDLSLSESTTVVECNDIVSAEAVCQTAVATSGISATPQVDFRLENNVREDVTVRTDLQSVTKVIVCLLNNAQKFTEQGSITLRASSEGDSLLFRIIDTGIGVPEEARERIFEKFEKVDNFREGIGLGLSVARTVARRIGGDVILEHSDTTGSTFLLRLPLKC
jgi:signal transduction histidine kinase